MMERIWGTDAEYLAHHRECLARALHEQRLVCARELLRRGCRREARAALELAGRAPVTLRALGLLPGGAVRRLLALRARVHRGPGGAGPAAR